MGVFRGPAVCKKTRNCYRLPMGGCLAKLDPPPPSLAFSRKTSPLAVIRLSCLRNNTWHFSPICTVQEVLSNTCWYGRYKKNVIKYVPQFHKKILTSTVTRHKRTPTHIVFLGAQVSAPAGPSQGPRQVLASADTPAGVQPQDVLLAH